MQSDESAEQCSTSESPPRRILRGPKRGDERLGSAYDGKGGTSVDNMSGVDSVEASVSDSGSGRPSADGKATTSVGSVLRGRGRRRRRRDVRVRPDYDEQDTRIVTRAMSTS